VDYTDSFSLVAKMVTAGLFLAFDSNKHWPIHQLDINNAYLHGFIDEKLYMLPSQGYTKAQLGQVCRLQKSLYGLKQAGRQWNKEFTSQLKAFGFSQSAHDHCLFVKSSGSHF